MLCLFSRSFFTLVAATAVLSFGTPGSAAELEDSLGIGNERFPFEIPARIVNDP